MVAVHVRTRVRIHGQWRSIGLVGSNHGSWNSVSLRHLNYRLISGLTTTKTPEWASADRQKLRVHPHPAPCSSVGCGHEWISGAPTRCQRWHATCVAWSEPIRGPGEVRMTTRARTLINQARTAAATGAGQSSTLLAQAVIRQARIARALHLAATQSHRQTADRIESGQR